MRPVLYSGGAKGADTFWANCASAAGHDVKIMSFNGHDCHVPKPGKDNSVHRRILVQKELDEGLPALQLAATRMKRHLPTNKPDSMSLLLRDYYQVIETQRVYAVGETSDNLQISSVGIEGGTGYTCQIFYDMQQSEGPIELYFFDQKTHLWYRFEKSPRGPTKVLIREPPVIEGSYTGIGTRGLTIDSEEAIKELYRRSVQQ